MLTLTLEKQGETITFLSEIDPTAPVGHGELRIQPGASGPPPHVHPRQREAFQVVSGRMRLTLGGEEHTIGAGESATVQPGQAHTFANASASEPLVVRTTIEPQLHLGWFLREMARSANRNGGSWGDVPLLEAAYIIHQVRGEYRLAGPPALVHDAVFALLARVAVLLGRTRHIAPKPVPPATLAPPRASSPGA